MRIIWRLYHLTAYLRLVAPLLKWSLHLRKVPAWLKWIVCPAVAALRTDDVIEARKRRLRHPQNEIAKKIREVGYADISSLVNLTTTDIQSVRDYFYAQEGYDSQVPMQSSLVPEPIDRLTKQSVNYISFSVDVSLGNNVVERVATSSVIKNISDDYLSFEPVVYSINTMLTIPSGQAHAVTDVHRDYDDILFLACFIYWTDTAKDNGATYFVPGSHFGRPGEGIYLEGKAGSVFLVDTFGFHAGNKQIRSPRLATWIRFGSIPNLAYVCDKNYLFL